MSEQMLFILVIRMRRAAIGAGNLTGVDVHSVLSFFGEDHGQNDLITLDPLTHIFTQFLLFSSIFVESGHKISEWPGHLENDVNVAPVGKNQCVLVRNWVQAEQPRGLGWTPFAAGAIGQRNHDRLQIFADDLELAHTFKLHGLSGQILLRRDCVCEYVQQQGPGTGRMNPEGHYVADHGLKSGGISTSDLTAVNYDYLHDKSFEADSLVIVGVFAVEFEIVVKDQAVLHVTRHFKPDSSSTCNANFRNLG